MVLALVGPALNVAAIMSPDDWLILVTALQRQPCVYAANPADQAFMRRMVNSLTLDDPPIPTPAEQKWILTLKRECLRSQ
jgi:hypothetical protein